MAHIVSLTVLTKPDEDASAVLGRFGDLAVDLQASHSQVTVHCIDLEDSTDDGEVEDCEEIGEFFDEGTMQKVLDSIMSYVESEDDAREIITVMQNAGILFREIRK
jgi:hypothetical protein